MRSSNAAPEIPYGTVLEISVAARPDGCGARIEYLEANVLAGREKTIQLCHGGGSSSILLIQSTRTQLKKARAATWPPMPLKGPANCRRPPTTFIPVSPYWQSGPGCRQVQRFDCLEGSRSLAGAQRVDFRRPIVCSGGRNTFT